MPERKKSKNNKRSSRERYLDALSQASARASRLQTETIVRRPVTMVETPKVNAIADEVDGFFDDGTPGIRKPEVFNWDGKDHEPILRPREIGMQDIPRLRSVMIRDLLTGADTEVLYEALEFMNRVVRKDTSHPEKDSVILKRENGATLFCELTIAGLQAWRLDLEDQE